MRREAQCEAAGAPTAAEILGHLAQGRVDEAGDATAALPEGDALRLVAEADVRLLRLAGTAAAAHELLRHPAVAAGGPYRLWVQAVVAEQLLLDGDVAAPYVAEAALGEVSDEPLLDLPLLYARGRLRRVVALSLLASDEPDERARGRAVRDAATADLRRCGFDAEVVTTRAFAAGLQILFHDDDTLERLEGLAQAYAAVAGHRSVWMPAVQALVALAALQAGDHEFMKRVLDDEGAPSSDPGVRATPAGTDNLSRLCDITRAAADVVVSEAAPATMAALEERFTSLSDCHLLYVRAGSLLVAHALLDLGNPRAARVAGHVLDLPDTGPVVRAEAELLRCRLAVVGGQAVTAEKVLTHAGEMASRGRPRHAAVHALRLATDLTRYGWADEADVLSGWAASRLPGPKRRTPMEQRWCDRAARSVDAVSGNVSVGGPGSGTGQATASAHISGHRRGDVLTVIVSGRSEPARPPLDAPPPAAIVIRLLHPVPSVEVHGRQISLPDAQARLVVFVVLGHPRPLHIEQLGDRLWPDVPLQLVRVRMNSLLYRLRRSLGPTSHELIDRSGDLVRLDPGACAVDLFELRARVAAGGAAAGAALASIRSNLCPAHDPYDEHLIEARRQFAAEWTAQSRNAVRRHLVTMDQLVAPAHALDVDLDELVPINRGR